MNTRFVRIYTILSICCFCSVRGAYAQEALPVIEWNEKVLAIAEAEDGFLTLKGLRTTAMMHAAMHDALNNVRGMYATYAYGRPTPDADAIAAAIEAAFGIAVDQYPDQQEALQQLRDRWMPASSAAVQAGIALGQACAHAILNRRSGDGWDREAEYTWHPMGPGVYAEFNEHSGTPEGFVFGAGWGMATPFGMKAGDQFLAPAPPEINSDAYTKAFEEVKEVGRFQSVVRTVDQTHLALWWKDFAENSHNRLARRLAREKQLGLYEASRLFALLNMSLFDAYVSSFYNKFLYNHWRPYTAIRWAEHDGNPQTAPEENWTNTHRHTYAFPSYPSAHGTACAAAMTALADTFGDSTAFTMYTERVDIAGPFSGKILMKPPTRRFGAFSEAAMECALSRVYLGIHFRYDSEEGYHLGQRIGSYVVQNHLQRK